MPALVPVDSTAGAAFIGHLLSTLIFGFTCLQVYEYYTVNSSRDARFLRYFVATIMVLDMVHLCCVTHTLYWYLVTNFGDYDTLGRIVWSIEVQVGIADVITFLIQG
ncbi:hypothetical protein AURDEDRAFT_58435 [Auricularia subglabra TFB-10046 SS5]|nr:hypothetical protein AURDEDRAFT_58435 [Auricularia subglabra TFB-10046 SS5]